MSAEKRQIERINVDRLTENLKNFTLDRLVGSEVFVETYDASTIGLGLSVPMPSTEFKTKDHIVIRTIDGKHKLVGEIKYVYEKSSDSCRVGLEFKQTRSLLLYSQMLAGQVK